MFVYLCNCACVRMGEPFPFRRTSAAYAFLIPEKLAIPCPAPYICVCRQQGTAVNINMQKLSYGFKSIYRKKGA